MVSLVIGGGTMSNKVFTQQEQEKLKSSKWVKKVTEKSVSFTEEFKIEFLNQYSLGKLPRQIFEDYGIDISILGIKRVEQCTDRFKKQNKRIEGFTDQRPLKSGQFKEIKLLDKDDEIELLKRKNAELQQELEFLKKMEFLARQTQIEKSKQFSCILAFVVLYNLGTMSFTERYRELCTLKVLGFKNNKIRTIMITQTIWLSLLGIAIGVPLGMVVLKLLIKLLASEYEMKIYYAPYVYIISIVVTFAVSLLVSWIVSRKTKKINMVESLKAE